MGKRKGTKHLDNNFRRGFGTDDVVHQLAASRSHDTLFISNSAEIVTMAFNRGKR